MKRVAGFSLIELLVVIAIIAILSAIIFPVFSRAKNNAYKNSDMASMNQLRTALQLYFADQEGYPPALLGYVTLYTTGPDIGNVIPANKLKSYLYSDRVKALTTFKPSYNTSEFLDTTTAVYPNKDPRGPGNPVLDLNGDGIIDATDDFPEARQRYGPLDGNVCIGGGTMDRACASGVEAVFYSVSGYDVATVRGSIGNLGTELRYTLFWTEFSLDLNGSAFDDPRQLGYTYPPDDTVITWNSYFREYDANNEPISGNLDIVLYVGGSAKAYDSRVTFDRSWRIQVNP